MLAFSLVKHLHKINHIINTVYGFLLCMLLTGLKWQVLPTFLLFTHKCQLLLCAAFSMLVGRWHRSFRGCNKHV